MSNRIFLSPPWLCGQERERVEEAFASNYIAPCGPMVDRFEREFAAVVGLEHACAVASGTAALELLFHELGVGRGDRVFCSDLTFVASVGPAAHRGAEPVFIDSDPATWTMGPDLLEEALSDAARAGRLPKAVVAVDLYGQCCDYGRLEPLCERHGVPLIIDAAEALGALYGRSEGPACGRAEAGQEGRAPARPLRAAGQAGWAAAYSFNGNKIITTSGGGMVASQDGGVVARARQRAQQAREPAPWYEHRELGFNHRMSNIVAAVGVAQLAELPRIVAKKRQIFEWYRERLADEVRFMPEAAYGTCTRWLTVAERVGGAPGPGGKGPSEAVMRVIGALEAANIESRPVWKPMHLQPVFAGAKVYGGAVAESLFRGGLCLPSGAGLEEADVARVSAIVRRALIHSEL